ncbi:MAG: MBL fold metallo-hydrolase [Spirochaetes bacterium]|nr:MBL fold metallo-hydrolase [Spirochaetota bacterium]
MKIQSLKDKPLALTTEGPLALFFVGVGSAFTKRQYQTNLLILKGRDHLLVDCGTKCPQALSGLNINPTDIRNLLITHSHADHIGGLEELALMGRYVTKKKPTMVINETYQHILWDMSLRGGCGYNEEEAGVLLSFTDFFDVIRPHWLPDFPRETFNAQVGTINIKTMRTKHIPDSSNDWESSFWSCGVMIDDRILFTSDTKFDAELVNYYNDTFKLEFIFHDCQFFTGGVHAGIDELNTFSPAVKEKMYLCHYGDNWEQNESRVRDYGFAGLAQQHCYYIFD